MRYELAGSSGVIGYKPNVDKLFGMPIKLTAGGMSCDLIDTHMVETTHNERDKHIQTNKSLGVIGSSLEHLVLEQLFATNGEQGFSAVKAIQVANQEGQKIFTITKDNYQEIIPQLNLAPAAIADIQSAAKAGYTITTHQNRISLNGYTGEGYIILDSSGNGAWMINGGMYGGTLVSTIKNNIFVFLAILADMIKHIGPKLGFVGGMLLNIASAFDYFVDCLFNGNKFDVIRAVTVIILMVVLVSVMVYMMSTLLVASSTGLRFGVALIYEWFNAKHMAPLTKDC